MQTKKHPSWPRRTLALSMVAAALSLLACAPLQAQTLQAVNSVAAAGKLQLARQAAQRDLRQFIEHHMQTKSGSAPAEFPLEVNDVQDLRDAKIEYGFQVHTVDPTELLASRSPLRNMIKPTAQWRFVIALNGKPIGLATVEEQNGRYDTVAYGAAVLAKDVDATAAVHGNSERSNLRFVRVYQAQSDFLEVVSAKDGQARYAPLHSARESLLMQQRALKEGSNTDSLIEAQDLLAPLKSAVKSNVDSFR